jgi:outer membrane receptor protein involved in Fe transport
MRKSNLRATAAWQALALLGAGAIATPAFAQDTTAPASSETAPAAEEQPTIAPEAQQDSDDAIVVTGSRLVRPELDAPSPVTTVDSETFDLTGTVTVETLLNELPQLIPGNTRTSNNQGGEDFSTLDLRGLGPNRTLIQIDGERVPASSTTGVVDIGTIPAGLIERVDVVTGGASAVYGSDAMAGVVNFILKDNYEGMEVSSQYGISEAGDGQSFNIQGLLGGNFGDDRGNLTFFTSYYTRDSVGQGDRDISRNQDVIMYDYDTGQYFVPEYLTPQVSGSTVIVFPGGSGTPPWGWIANSGAGKGADKLFGTADDTGNPFGGAATGTDCGDDGICGPGAGPDGELGTDDDTDLDDSAIFNPATGLGTLLPGTFGAGNTDTNCDGVAGGFVQGGQLSFNDLGQLTPRNTSNICNYADRSTGSSRYNFNPVNYLVTPYTRWNMALTGRYDISDAIRLKIVANYTDSSQEVSLAPTPATGISVQDPLNNPFIQNNGACGVVSCHADLLAALMSRPNPDAPFTIDRRFSETGPRIGIFQNKTATLRGTLSGPLAHGFNWDATLSYGRSDQTVFGNGSINFSAVQQGLNTAAMVDPDGAGPLPAAAVCDGVGILPGCVPIDIFGAGTLTPDMISFVQIDTKETRRFDQARLSGNITGNLLDLPAGPLGIAIGAEVRTDRGQNRVDDAQRTGNIYGFNAVQDTRGKINVKELYGEARIPILADLPFVHEFSVEAGARFSDYSSVGGLFNWKLGAQWAPTEWLKFRGVFNKAARAPSVIELFQNGDQGFPAYIDRCNAPSSGDPLDPAILAICQAQAPGFDFSSFNQNNAQVQAFAFGNPGLAEESAKTFTLGAVLTPNLGLGRFSATIDYYDITIKDVVTTQGAQFWIDQCYLNGDVGACDRIVRDPDTGDIDSVNTSVVNGSSFKTSGVDVGINYAVPFNDIGLGIGGRFRFQTLVSWLDNLQFTEDGFNYAGATAGGIGGTFPEWKATTTFAYDSDDFTAQLRWNWNSDMDDVGWDTDRGISPDLKGLSYFDLSLRKSIGNNFELTGIVQNMFNQKANETVSGVFLEGGIDASYFGPIILGRSYTIQAKVKM